MHMRVVEHYHKKQSYYIEEECKENELRVTSSGKPQDLASKAAHLMRVRLGGGGGGGSGGRAGRETQMSNSW